MSSCIICSSKGLTVGMKFKPFSRNLMQLFGILHDDPIMKTLFFFITSFVVVVVFAVKNYYYYYYWRCYYFFHCCGCFDY